MNQKSCTCAAAVHPRDDCAAEPTILVLGIGNVLLSDDGAGVHAMHLLRSDTDPSVHCVDGGTVGLALAPLIEDADAFIVLDATRLGAMPGTVHTLIGADMDAMVGRHSKTPHEAGLADLMSAVRLQGRLPARRALIGIEPDSIEWGTEPTPRVAQGVVQAAAAARALLAQWRADMNTEIAHGHGSQARAVRAGAST